MNISFTIGVCGNIETKLDEQFVLERIRNVVDNMSHPLEVFENSFVDEIYSTDNPDEDYIDGICLSISIGEVIIDKELD